MTLTQYWWPWDEDGWHYKRRRRFPGRKQTQTEEQIVTDVETSTERRTRQVTVSLQEMKILYERRNLIRSPECIVNGNLWNYTTSTPKHAHVSDLTDVQNRYRYSYTEWSHDHCGACRTTHITLYIGLVIKKRISATGTGEVLACFMGTADSEYASTVNAGKEIADQCVNKHAHVYAYIHAQQYDRLSSNTSRSQST